MLLDSHILLWWLEDSPRLKPRVRAAIADPASEAFVSFASVWEIAIKHQIGKLGISSDAIMQLLDDQRFTLLPFNAEDCARVEAMPWHHGDPFDHMIIAQAMGVDAVIVTADSVFARYDIRCLPA
ncbi:type II toxin-antitoxin system VapC family toxin [Alterisphingorhabdus coralli]|uniref:Type II toxin-antitoxin system VapC family toxin n=1 Tax=Alterisphingorhabdus coralli TaxID=3071408 RepID=A0AA97F525_9SPHN|nr:type II toxin-antitoxin system VapC family toxin [Parasphingorhabdus sp. SCSIO 66989]WOE74474.1 type II toxin-antitoxin system VapC family toxin [Parasphingorhabdus sp. SCSIO 66989]